MVRALYAAACCVGMAAPALANPITFDCDVPADKFSSVSSVASGPAYRVSGTISKIEMRSGRFIPMVGVLVERSDRYSLTGFQLVPAVAGSDSFAVTFRRIGTAKNETARVGLVDLKRDVSFEFRLSQDGAIILKLADETYTWDAGPDFAKLNEVTIQAMCSTGQFKFFDLVLSDSEQVKSRDSDR